MDIKIYIYLLNPILLREWKKFLIRSLLKGEYYTKWKFLTSYGLAMKNKALLQKVGK